MSGCVTVTGPPASICLRKIGTTLPLLPRTLPKRTATNRVGLSAVLRDWTYNSAQRLDAPMTLVGLTALSVLTMTNAAHPLARAASATDPGAEDVVLDRLAGIAFHHRHVLVGGAVENDLRLMQFENPRDPPRVADVGDQRNHFRSDPAVTQLAVDLEKIVFRLIEQDQPARTKFHGLPADFRADAAAGAGDQNALAGEEPLKLRGVEADGLSAQKIVQIGIRR